MWEYVRPLITPGLCLAIAVAILRAAYPRIAQWTGYDPVAWGVAALRRVLHIKNPRRAAEAGRSLIAALAGLVLLALWVGGNWLFDYLGPHEGEKADPVISIGPFNIVPRDPSKDGPLYGEIAFNVSGASQILNDCGTAGLLSWNQPAPDSALRNTLAALVWRLDGQDRRGICNETLAHKDSGNWYTITAYSQTFIADRDVDEALAGRRYIYMFAAWRYTLPNSSTIYVSEFCWYFRGSLTQGTMCPGDYNKTFVHKGI